MMKNNKSAQVLIKEFRGASLEVTIDELTNCMDWIKANKDSISADSSLTEHGFDKLILELNDHIRQLVAKKGLKP